MSGHVRGRAIFLETALKETSPMNNPLKTPSEIKHDAHLDKEDKREMKSMDYPMTDQNGDCMQHACDEETAYLNKQDVSKGADGFEDDMRDKGPPGRDAKTPHPNTRKPI
jgi:hypothetical protein